VAELAMEEQKCVTASDWIFSSTWHRTKKLCPHDCFQSNPGRNILWAEWGWVGQPQIWKVKF